MDDVILVEDASVEATEGIAHNLGVRTVIYNHNLGCGGNHKTRHREGPRLNADIAVMVRPDHWYSLGRIPSIARLIASGHYDVACGLRIIGGGNPPGRGVLLDGLNLQDAAI